MKKNESSKRTASSRERAVAAARRELEKLGAKKGCYAPFSLKALIESATPRKPSARRPTTKVVTRLRKSAQELLNRACAGESDAASEFCWFAHNLIRQLTYLLNNREAEITKIAASYEDWPILYAPDDKASLEIYTRLGVGTDSFVERYAGRKIDWNNPWTERALLVLGLLQWCKKRLPEIRNQPCRKILRWVISVGRTKIRIYYYDTPSGVFAVPEWCELCPSLPEKLRPGNMDDFWKPARLAVLQYWYESERAGGSAYADALNSAYPGKHGLDSERRNNALDAIKRAMGSLAGANKT